MEKVNKISPEELEETTSGSNTPKAQRKQSWQDQPKKSASLDSLEEYGEPLKFDPDFSGPIKRRKCTGMLLVPYFRASPDLNLDRVKVKKYLLL